MTEAETQRDILAYLRRRNILHARTNAGRAGTVHLAPAGWPDIVCCYKGRFVGIEVKAKGGKLTEAQIVTLLRIKDAGGIAVVARCVADVADELA